jgi:hypothetical protein
MKNLAWNRQKTTVVNVDEKGDSSINAAISTTTSSKKKAANKKGKPRRAKKPKVAPVAQGRWKIPTAGDGSGCRHHGLRELTMCDKAWMAAYVKEGAWLHKKPCVDCAARGESTEETSEKVLDVSVLLRLKQQCVAYICNCGPTGHKMEEGEEGKDEYQCDMMLCLPCFSERESKMEAGDGGKRKRRQRNRVDY